MAGAKHHCSNEYHNAVKRKHVTLTVLQKTEILKKLDAGATPNSLAHEFQIGVRTVYDIKKNKDKILKFCAKSDTSAGISSRKSMRPAKSDVLDNVLYEWFKQRRREGVPITGPLLQEKAKALHKELNIGGACFFSSGWLTRFKQRHGIRYLKLCGEKVSADDTAAEEFADYFSEFAKTNNLRPEQVYNADESGLFWRCMPKQSFVASDESGPSGFKDCKDRITFLVCSNASGTHKCKLMVIAKSAHPRALKGVKDLPVTYRSNKKAWMTRDIMQDWFKNHFVKEARQHCNEAGLPSDCKIILLIDNCTAHPDTLEANNVMTVFLPPNTTSPIQPMDQGIIHSLKCSYKTEFLRKMIMAESLSEVDGYKKNFNIKDAIFLLAKAWNSVSSDTLVHAWHNMWPASIFFDETDNEEFGGFHIKNTLKNKTEELVLFAKTTLGNAPAYLNENNLCEWISSQEENEITEKVTDQEIIDSVLNVQDKDNSETDSDDEGEKVTLDEGLLLGEKYLNFLEKLDFITEQDIMTVQKIQEKILSKKNSKALKQTTITAMFDKLKK